MMKHQQSSFVVSETLKDIDNRVWEIVAINKVGKMTPNNIKLMNQYTFQSLAELSSTYLQKADPLDEKQIGPINPKQTIIESSVPVTKKSQISFMPNSSTLINSKLRKIPNQNKNSRASSKVEPLPRSKTNKSLASIFKFVSLDQKQGNTKDTVDGTEKQKTIELQINAERDKLLFLQSKQKQQQRVLELKFQQKMEKQAKLRKKLKQIQRLSYDYSGDFFNTTANNLNGTLGGAAFMKSTINHQRLPTMTENKKTINNLRMKTVSTLIQNSRIQQRKQKMKEGRLLTESMETYFKESNAARFSKHFKQDDCLKEGCKIQQKSMNFSMERTLNRSGEYKTLEQFKKEAATRKYKQFRLKTSKKLKTSKMKMDLNQEQDLQESELIKQTNGNQYGSDRQFKTMISSEKSQVLSNSILSQKIGRSRQRGSIKVSNPSLYESVVSED